MIKKLKPSEYFSQMNVEEQKINLYICSRFTRHGEVAQLVRASDS